MPAWNVGSAVTEGQFSYFSLNSSAFHKSFAVQFDNVTFFSRETLPFFHPFHSFMHVSQLNIRSFFSFVLLDNVSRNFSLY